MDRVKLDKAHHTNKGSTLATRKNAITLTRPRSSGVIPFRHVVPSLPSPHGQTILKRHLVSAQSASPHGDMRHVHP